jgi:hypothetical protein
LPSNIRSIIFYATKSLAQKTVEDVLRYFADSFDAARRRYRDFVKSGIRQGTRPEFQGGGEVARSLAISRVNVARCTERGKTVLDQSQPRIFIETQIVVVLLLMASEGHLELVDSFALAYENSKNPRVENRTMVSELREFSSEYVSYDQ